MLDLGSLVYLFLFALLTHLGIALEIAPIPTFHFPITSIHITLPTTTSTPTPPSTSSTISVPLSSPTCLVNDNSLATTLNLSFTETDPATGNPLTVYVDQVISKPGASTPIKSSLSLSVYLNSEELYTSNRVIFQNSTTGGTITWEALTGIPHTVSFTVGTNNVTTGAIDGKPFSPLYVGQNVSTIDLRRRGEIQPLLQITPLPSFDISLEWLQASVTEGMQLCQSELNIYYVPSNVSHSVLLPRDDRTQDFGHPSGTYTSSSCINCNTNAVITAAAAALACSFGTCWWTFGAGCAVCAALAAAGEVIAMENCIFSGSCCPITCGQGSFPFNPPTCCFGDESCLNPVPGFGTCCSEGKQTCVGKECCNSDQSCITEGSQQGTCCPTDATCGQNCCPSSTDLCLDDSVCCDPANLCGGADGVCCNPIVPTYSGPVLIQNYCADESLRLCCPQGTVAVDGVCCESGAINCNGKCCLGTYNPDGTCNAQPTVAQCVSQGYMGTCESVPGCGHGYVDTICEENGCCLNVNIP